MPLFQESLRVEPFWMLAACMLVNRTRWAQAGPVLSEIRTRWPTPADLSVATPCDVEPVVRRLGFGRQRAAKLVRYAADWVATTPTAAADVLLLHGCGKYAADSWAIFVDGRCDVEPTDHYLAGYLAGRRGADA